ITRTLARSSRRSPQIWCLQHSVTCQGRVIQCASRAFHDTAKPQGTRGRTAARTRPDTARHGRGGSGGHEATRERQTPYDFWTKLCVDVRYRRACGEFFLKMRVERLGSSRWKDFLHEVERAGENIVSERTLKRFEEGKHKPDMQTLKAV